MPCLLKVESMHRIRRVCWRPSPLSRSVSNGVKPPPIRRPTADGSVQGRSQFFYFISFRFFDIVRNFPFFCEIQIALRILYTTSSFCKKIPGNARNIWQLRNPLKRLCLYLFVRALRPLAHPWPQLLAALAIMPTDPYTVLPVPERIIRTHN
jgi:hypothetical protein